MTESYDPQKERMAFLDFGQIWNTQLLDIGVGKAVLSIIAAKNRGCHVVCIDSNMKKLEYGEKIVNNEGLSDKIQFELQDVRVLSYYDRSFAAVACFSTLHHLETADREKALKEIVRVAQEKVIISELTPIGAKYFDEVLHPNENHQKMLVSLDWVKNQLTDYEKIQISERKYTYFISVVKQ